MKTILKIKILLLLTTLSLKIVWGQNVNFVHQIKLYDNILPLLTDTQKFVFGLNYQLNDYIGFDGTVLQLGTRTRPFQKKQNLLKYFETGLLINGYFNKDFYVMNACCGGAISDYAWDGYDISLFFNQKILLRPVKIQLSFAPRLNLFKATTIQYKNGKYELYDLFYKHGKYYGGAMSLILEYKTMESWISYNLNPIEQIFVDWGTADLFMNNYLFDTTKTYYFRASQYSRNLRYSFSIKLHKLIKAPIRLYYYSNFYHQSVGLLINVWKLELNPEYTFYLHQYYKYYGNNGHQIGLFINFRINKRASISYSILFSENGYYSRKTKSNIGIQYTL